MTIGTLDATSAYGRAMQVASSLEPTTSANSALGSEQASGSFASLVQGMVTDAAGSLRSAEAASARQVAGKGDLIDVVTAMGAAETALDTVVSVRDRVVSAYSEIMRMQV
ncbi:flagellar hook-basal body complex protein FliE [Novosphingobium profundi]|uniref:flagellar hook-basal body complex protein FliE n=1 Tax=Novosphingobium profundi TaxID=1774954 RepID=UPI001BD9DAA2|nr:flagellar hook-basal body complex protein FliE [Novosphingobium profundi]MBT0670542.1 flagellar hook-basal body complex protein FliE [Novosphingobium profundi]